MIDENTKKLMDMEIWKDIEGYEGLYQVSNMGRVKSLHFNKEKIIKPIKDKKGYLRISLSKNGKSKCFSIHRLVAKAFVDGYEEGLDVNHINEIKTDNRAKNLEWCTKEYNCNYGTRNNRIKIKNLNSNGKKIRCIELDKVFNSIAEAGRYFKCSSATICYCLRGKNETAMNYHWEYVD